MDFGLVNLVKYAKSYSTKGANRYRFVFLAIWAIRPRLCFVYIASLNHANAATASLNQRFSKRPSITVAFLT